MGIFTEIFSWWSGNTIGTRFYTWRNGRLVGTDGFGNSYYEQIRGIGPAGVPRRWVTYKQHSEATLVPPEWHGWLHYTVDTPPTKQDYEPHEWELPHKPNMSGTPEAYRPQGSILSTDDRPRVTGDYQAWKP